MFSIRAITASIRTPAVMSRRALATTVERASCDRSEPVATVSEKHSYLKALLSEDDAEALWHQSPVEMVSREVQAAAEPVHKSW
ncbi:hypothetical protein GGF46_004034 [Coemansia sp. RSA 552]|nr:hypothetical protein GGF46_004034 [Coemansia sp. RSA 552]